jgi:dipeptidyl aminopeptidase/acylaminoacyl peptidase
MMTIRMNSCAWALAGLLAVLPLGAAGAAEPLDLELAFSQNQLRRMEQPNLSRDGRWLAYEVYAPPERSPGSDLEAEPRILPNGTPASSVGLQLFVSSVKDGTARAVCPAGINCWRPAFSPDGRLLAYYSDQGGYPQLYVYDVDRGTSRRVTEAPVKAKLWWVDKPLWSPDGTQVYVPLRPGLEPPEPPEASKAVEKPAGPTVSVYRTAAAAAAEEAPPAPNPMTEFWIKENNAEVAAIDVASGEVRVLAAADSEPRPSNLTLSPDGRWVAYSSLWRTIGESSSTFVYDIVVVPAAGGDRHVVATDVEGTDRFYFGPEWLWSPDSSRLAFTRGKRAWVVEFSELGPSEPRLLADELGDLNELPFAFTADGGAILVGLMPPGAVAYYHVPSKQLALVPLDGRPPKRLEASGTPVMADGATLWQPHSGALHLIRTAEGTAERTIVRLDLATGVERAVWRGQGRIGVVGLEPGDGSVVVRFENLTTPPDFYSFENGFTSLRRITTVEPRLDDVAVGPMEMFETLIPTFDGSLVRVQSAVFLPAGWRSGEPLPTVVYFYAGSRFSELAQDYGGGAPNSIPVQIFATRGYAVLFVDVPLSPQGEIGGNPLEEMTDAILAQVYQAAAKGYVDLDRVAITGQSYGGYGTAAIISHTNLFRAAMALDGVYDLASGFAKMDPGGGSFSFVWSETGQGRMGTHPWVNLQRYLANSPYFRADRIHTPLLLIHGAIDKTCPVEQAEEMYNALKRLERIAELAVYAGEGHVPGDWSLINAVDATQRMLNWLERYLKVEE